jgi:hypothetical protein
MERENIIVTVGLSKGITGRQERKREWTILKYIASVYEDGVTKCIESY